MIQSDRPERGGARNFVRLLSSDLSKIIEETFTSKSKRTRCDPDEGETRPAKRSRPSHGGQGGKTCNGLRHGEQVYHDLQVVDAFSQAGYTLESNDVDENGWEPLNKVKYSKVLFVDLN